LEILRLLIRQLPPVEVRNFVESLKLLKTKKISLSIQKCSACPEADKAFGILPIMQNSPLKI
jgi:hypothetical protein